MTLINYLKCKDGVPVKPTAVTLDPAYLPEEEGITWVPFDTEAIYPVAVKDTLVNGEVVQDQDKRDAWDAHITEQTSRDAGAKAAKTSGHAKLKVLGLTEAEIEAM